MAEGNIFQSLKTSMLYVKFDYDDISDEELYNHFNSYYPDGEIVSCKVGRGGFRKFAYVNYINHKQATIAVELLNATMLRNKPIKVKFSPGHQNNIGSIIYIKNFDKSLDKDYLQELVSPYGNTLVIKLPTDASDPAAVQYDSVESAQTAMKALYGKLIMNKRLYVYTNEKIPGDDENGDSIFLDIVSDRLSEHYLLETFSPFGSITRVRVYDDFPKGGLLGSVVFKDPASAAKAAEALTSGFNPNLQFVRRFWDRSRWERFQEEESNRLMLENQRMSCGTEEEASGTDLDGIYSKVISEVYQQLTILDAEKCRAMSQLDGIYSRAISNIKHHVTLFEVEQMERGYLHALKKRNVVEAFDKTKLAEAVDGDHLMDVEQSFTA